MPRMLCLFILLMLGACTEHRNKAELTIEHATRGAFAAAISHDGRYSLVSSVDHGVSLWDNQAHGLKYQWQQSSDDGNLVHSLAISYDNSSAVTAESNTFAIWDITSGENKGYYKIKTGTIRDIAISNQGRYVLYGRSDNVVIHLDLITGRRIEFLGHQEKINSIALSPNGFFALTGANDYSAYFWDTRTGQVMHRFNHPSRVTKVALDATGQYAFTADSLKKASIWQLSTGDLVSQLQYIARQKIFSAVRFNNTGDLLLTGSPSRQLSLWRINDGQELKSWFVEPRTGSRPKSAVVFDVAFVNDDTALLTESSSGLLERFSYNN